MFVKNLGCDCCLEDMAIKRTLARHIAEAAQALRKLETVDKLDAISNNAPLCERSTKVIKMLTEVQDEAEKMYKLKNL